MCVIRSSPWFYTWLFRCYFVALPLMNSFSWWYSLYMGYMHLTDISSLGARRRPKDLVSRPTERIDWTHSLTRPLGTTTQKVRRYLYSSAIDSIRLNMGLRGVGEKANIVLSLSLKRYIIQQAGQRRPDTCCSWWPKQHTFRKQEKETRVFFRKRTVIDFKWLG